jgi:hypothetical protein
VFDTLTVLKPPGLLDLVIPATRRRVSWLGGPLIAACLFLALAPPAEFAQAGELDSTFSGDGEVTTDLTRRADFAAAIAIQADGKIVVAGGAEGADAHWAR